MKLKASRLQIDNNYNFLNWIYRENKALYINRNKKSKIISKRIYNLQVTYYLYGTIDKSVNLTDTLN